MSCRPFSRPPPKPTTYAIQRSGSESGGDQIAVRADDQTGIFAAWIDLEHFFVRVVGFARRAKRAEDAAVHRRFVRGAQTNGATELVQRIRIVTIDGEPFTRQAQRLVDRAVKRGGDRPAGAAVVSCSAASPCQGNRRRSCCRDGR